MVSVFVLFPPSNLCSHRATRGKGAFNEGAGDGAEVVEGGYG